MKKLISTGIVLSTLFVSISSYKKDNTSTTGTSGNNANDINVSTNATFGKYLSNKQGLTLYIFANDADGVSSCTGDCKSLWPPFTTDLSTAKLDAGLAAADFGTITIASGKKQVTYKGWPLYTYSPSVDDGYGNTTNRAETAGSTTGDGVAGLWFIAKPDYTIMLANKQLTGLEGNNYK
ncbi:MAG: COG4315 family predicted lipoprotein [Ginsengibacter sp.]